MLSSIATLMHDTYLPIYMSDVLHMSNTGMGNLHALLQFLSKASGVVSGRLADLLSPARMVILGTGLTALLCKPMFAVCGLILDRTVKGVREAPSKALVGELAAQSGDSAAAAFSVRQALSTLGMLLGTTAAGLAFALSGRSYEVTFALSAVASLMALALVATAFGRDAAAGAAERAELTRTMDEQDAGMTLGDKARALKDAFPPAYWQALAVVMALYLARFDVAFITLHASAVMDKARIPTLTFFSMAPVVALATPMGLRAKQSVAARNRVLMLGMSALIAANICFALVPSYLGMAAGNAFIGLHMAMTQGIAFGMLASYIPSGVVPGLGRVNGTAWSLTDLLLGVALAGSNTLAGRLADWSKVRGLGVRGCFGGAAAACLLSMAVLAAFSTFGDLGKEDLRNFTTMSAACCTASLSARLGATRALAQRPAGLRAAPLRRSVRQAVRAAAGSDEDVGTAGKAAIALGLLANPITLWSEWTLKTTGSGLPPGPGGALGAAEGISYLVVVGIVAWSIATKAKTGSGLPAGPAGLLGAVEGFSYLSLLAGLVVFGLQVAEKGSLPGMFG
ncbi:hypothetical protein COHA_009808 [Chlorella ohadii]|uniref:Major facilitator superfamily (MFS) profile domain-containing protein n=1 Tax=Chlorella ohadii TaxID=2649997 RepID=A0AAD5H148_9CHLO|nr:hypothetical protein COHA_009808 [Chlorella ohadii]